MRKGLVFLAAAATLGTAALSSPASAAGQHYNNGYHDGRDRGGHWDHRGRDWHGGDRRREREWRWHHRHEGYGHHGGYGRNYYGR